MHPSIPKIFLFFLIYVVSQKSFVLHPNCKKKKSGLLALEDKRLVCVCLQVRQDLWHSDDNNNLISGLDKCFEGAIAARAIGHAPGLNF